MAFWSKLFGGNGGGASAGKATPIEHAGFAIYAEPLNDGGRWRIGARIQKEIDGEVKTHQMIRADTLDNAEAAGEASVAKARMLIDQQGDAIFS